MKSLSRPARRSRSRLLLLGSAFGLATAPQLAGAESLDLAEVAAALAMPVITGGYPGNAIEGTDGDLIAAGAALTINTVTNTASSPVVLRVDVISGDPRQRGDGASFDEDNWQSTSFDCPITGRETVAFLFIAGGAPGENSLVFADCAGLAISRPLETGNGILFVGIAEPSGTVVSEDLIFGDSIVIDTQVGAAFSFDAVPFQAGAGANDGDKTYAFDGFEYAEFPSLVSTNFLAPSDDVLAELVLFTLDGTTGQLPPPRARLTGVAYNDDEVPFDFQYEFECFDIVALDEIDPNFVGGFPGLGSFVGHVQLRPHPIGRAGFDAHDAMYGDGNSIRTAPVAGWLVQSVMGELLPAGALFAAPTMSPAVPVADLSAWARPLISSRSAIRPFLSDEPATFDAQP